MPAFFFLFHLNKMLFGRYEYSVLLTVQVILMRVRMCAFQLACKAKCLFVCYLHYALSHYSACLSLCLAVSLSLAGQYYTFLPEQRFTAVKCQFLGISIS